jgi:hypothetical protein
MVHNESLGALEADQNPLLFAVARIEGAVAVANTTTTGETALTGYLDPEFIAEREDSWIPREGCPVWLGCGDEGVIDEASTRRLQKADPATLNPAKGYMSIYGQTPGITKNVLAVGMAVYGDEFYDQTGGFDGVLNRLQRFMAADASPWAVRPAVHTDRTRENTAFADMRKMAQFANIAIPEDTAFCEQGLGPTGCAYNGGIGATSQLIATESLVQHVIENDLTYVFGDSSLSQPLINAHAQLAARLGPDFTFDRQAYAKSGMPIMVLERQGGEGDKHLPAAHTGALVNLDPETIGDASAAGAYRLDAAGIALLIRRIFKEYDLPADMLIASQLADAVAVRTVLASHDAGGNFTPDPRRIALGVRGGTIQQALAKITELERQ